METFLTFVALLPAIGYCVFWVALFFGMAFMMVPELCLLIIGFFAIPFVIIAYMIKAVKDVVVAEVSKSK